MFERSFFRQNDNGDDFSTSLPKFIYFVSNPGGFSPLLGENSFSFSHSAEDFASFVRF
jgi:hypothetical protein